MRIVINRCYGGFGLSTAAVARYEELGGPSDVGKRFRQRRADPILVRVVEEMGDAANGPHADLRIVGVPAGTAWRIVEFDGMEHVAADHRTWPARDPFGSAMEALAHIHTPRIRGVVPPTPVGGRSEVTDDHD